VRFLPAIPFGGLLFVSLWPVMLCILSMQIASRDA
jgi:hypothetical protein